ncbi:MAG: NAD(P)H-hydrate epimerase, partial [Pseudomonadota bacterium]
MELLTSNEMRQHERAAIEAGDVSGLELMERAGAGAVREAFSYWPALGLRRGRVLVLCGPGNNGGDGYVVARILAWRGWSVRLFAYGDPRQLPLDAAHNAARWREIGSIEAWDAERIAAVAAPDLVVDALFGIGLSRELPAEVASVLAFAATSTWTGSIPRWLAVDCPSGLDLDLGIFPGPGRQARADLSVTFHAPKPGHFFGLGPAACGDLRIVDIGLRPKPKPGAVLIGPAPGQVVAEGWAATHLPKIGGQGHKFTYGHTLVLSGGVGRGGAARLAARGALRAGAGLVTLFCPPAALPENAAGLDAIMLRSLPAPSELSDVVDDRVRTLCLGPGLGLEPAIKSLVEAALQLDRITVLDADALTVFTGTPEQLF